MRAGKTKDGWRTEVIERVGKERTRGATTDHATLAPALAAALAAKGWTPVQGKGGGYVREPDKFDIDHLPTAPKAPKPTSKK